MGERSGKAAKVGRLSRQSLYALASFRESGQAQFPGPDAWLGQSQQVSEHHRIASSVYLKEQAQ